MEIPIGAESAAYLQLGDVTVDQLPVRFTLSETVIPSDKPRQELVNTPKDPTHRATLTDEWITDPFPIKTGSSITFSDEYRMIHRDQIRSALPQQSMITIGFELVNENGQVLGTFRTRQITTASIPDDSKGTYRLTVPEGNAENARIRFLVSSNQPLESTHRIDLV